MITHDSWHWQSRPQVYDRHGRYLSEPFNSNAMAVYDNSALNRWGGDPPTPPQPCVTDFCNLGTVVRPAPGYN